MRISVIIPAYNVERYIEECLLSVLGQNCVQEIIVVNDGSTDQTKQIITKLIPRDRRIVLYQHEGGLNHGRSKTRNLGISRATSEWLAFLDADDYYLEDRFSHLEKIISPEIDGIYDSIKTIFESPELKKQFGETETKIENTVPPANLLDHLVQNTESRFSLNGFVIRKKAIQQNDLFDETLNIGEDTDFIWRLAAKNCFISSGLERPIAIRRVHGHNSYLNGNKTISGRKKFYEKWVKIMDDYSMSQKSKYILEKKLDYYKHVGTVKPGQNLVITLTRIVKLIRYRLGIKPF